MKKINYGFVRPKIDDTHYVLGGLGSLPKVVLQPDGQWDTYLPTYEPQYGGGWDTDGCTVWGTQNALETLVRKLCGREDNYSERFTYILAGIRPPGGDPHTVAETVRKNGLIPQTELPMTQNFNEFITPDPMLVEYLAKGKIWLNAFVFGHDWVYTKEPAKVDRIALIKEALTYSPVALSVTAWYQEGDVYVDRGQPNCHWCECYGWNDKGWKIFDSYDQSMKIYSFDSSIEFAKRYSLVIKNKEEQISKIKQLLTWLFMLLGFIEKHPDAKATDEVTSAAVEPVQPAIVPPATKYDWDTPILARHSTRVICDEESLTLEQKNTLCATVGAESGWKPNAIGKPNTNGSRDWGIVQVNDKLWVGEGKAFPTTAYVLANPEECVRWMCTQWKAGHRNWWMGYTSNNYKAYL